MIRNDLVVFWLVILTICLTQGEDIHSFTASAVGKGGVQTECSDGGKSADWYAVAHPY